VNSYAGTAFELETDLVEMRSGVGF
jgi:hypothetical protein